MKPKIVNLIFADGHVEIYTGVAEIEVDVYEGWDDLSGYISAHDVCLYISAGALKPGSWGRESLWPVKHIEVTTGRIA